MRPIDLLAEYSVSFREAGVLADFAFRRPTIFVLRAGEAHSRGGFTRGNVGSRACLRFP